MVLLKAKKLCRVNNYCNLKLSWNETMILPLSIVCSVIRDFNKTSGFIQRRKLALLHPDKFWLPTVSSTLFSSEDVLHLRYLLCYFHTFVCVWLSHYVCAAKFLIITEIVLQLCFVFPFLGFIDAVLLIIWFLPASLLERARFYRWVSFLLIVLVFRPT